MSNNNIVTVTDNEINQGNEYFIAGENYYFGLNGKTKNFKTALEFYLKGAKYNHIDSINSLG